MRRKRSNVQMLLPPSTPQQDLQEISQMEEGSLFTNRSFIIPLDQKICHGLINGWVKMKEQHNDPMLEHHSEIMDHWKKQAKMQLASRKYSAKIDHYPKIISKKSWNEESDLFSQFGYCDFHFEKRARSQQLRQPIKNSFHHNIHQLNHHLPVYSFLRKKTGTKSQKRREGKQEGRKVSVSAVSYPIFANPANPQKLATSIGKVRQLMQSHKPKSNRLL